VRAMTGAGYLNFLLDLIGGGCMGAELAGAYGWRNAG
jgi:hypothetical protein